MDENTFVSSNLKSRLRDLKNKIPDEVALRLHRSISWIGRAEQSQADKDAKFLFLWIAFNAAYASNKTFPDVTLTYAKVSEKEVQNDFFTKVVKLDNENLIYTTLWEKFSGPVRILMDNHYIFDPFWNQEQEGLQGKKSWEQAFEKSYKYFKNAFAQGNTAQVLRLVFSRLYTLRNQIIHGGSTWNSRVNRDQIRDGDAILTCLVPRFVHIMINNMMEDWGKPLYPPVDQD